MWIDNDLLLWVFRDGILFFYIYIYFVDSVDHSLIKFPVQKIRVKNGFKHSSYRSLGYYLRWILIIGSVVLWNNVKSSYNKRVSKLLSLVRSHNVIGIEKSDSKWQNTKSDILSASLVKQSSFLVRYDHGRMKNFTLRSFYSHWRLQNPLIGLILFVTDLVITVK